MEILGCRLDAIDANEAAQKIVEFARNRSAAQIVTLGTEMVVYAQRNESYRAVVNACALSLCDTIGLLAVARSRGAHLRDRVTGVELIDELCKRAAQEGLGVFFLGAAPGVADAAARELERRYPGLRVCGVRDGFFPETQSEDLAAQIRASNADILLVGLGFPRQEFWLAKYLAASGAGAGIGIGGSLDVISGNVRRAPEGWRRLGLEWLYRLVKEPQRWRRQLALPQFVLLVVGENVRSMFVKGKL